MKQVTKIIEIEMAHRLHNHPGKCKNIHGHTYKIEVTVASKYTTDRDMIIDFGDLKDIMARTVGRWDHALILHHMDPLAQDVVRARIALPGLLTVGYMPTAENMVFSAAQMIKELLPEACSLMAVKIWETSNSFAVWRA